METLVLIVVLATISAIMVAIGDKIHLPWPALMVLVGAGVSLVPAINLEIDPQLILPVFLPPLLYSATQRTSWQVLKSRWRSLLSLAIGLVVVTVAATTVTALAIIPGITLAAAIVLGAMVAPPDPVAVESVASSVPIPHRVLMTLQSEGLLNDAASLVIFQLALSAALTGTTPNTGRIALWFLAGSVIAAAVGWGCAWLVRRGTRLIGSSTARSAATLVLPFIAYLIAEHLEASGVIAVVVAGLQMRATDDPEHSEDRLTQSAMWGVLEVCITGVAFGFIGVEIRQIVLEVGTGFGTLFLQGLVVALVLVIVRLAWFLLALVTVRYRGATQAAPRKLSDVVLMTWGGMRGLATLALALALPTTLTNGSPFPARRAIMVIVIAVLFVTLLVAGLTFPGLVKLLKVDGETEAEVAEEERLRDRMRAVATATIARRADVPPDLVDHMTQWAREAAESAWDEGEGEGEANALRASTLALMARRKQALTTAKRATLEACRAEVVQARNEPGTDPEIADRGLRGLDIRLMALDQTSNRA